VSVARASVAERRRARFTIRAFVLASIVAAFVLAFVYPLRLYLQQHNQIAVLEQQTQMLTQQNAKLQQRVQDFSDPAYIRQYAARCWGFIPKGQTSYVVAPSGKSQPVPPQRNGC
jgi:cell division protein FtsB